MENLKFAFRKLKLQKLQVKKLSNSDDERYREQKEVLHLLYTHPKYLLSVKHRNKNENNLFKYVNSLNMSVKNDRIYAATVRELAC